MPPPWSVRFDKEAKYFRVRGATRPVAVYVPTGYEPAVPLPLVILLHGYTSNAKFMEDFLPLWELADSRGFLVCYPESTTGPTGNTFWNATGACCDFQRTGTDDSGWLRALIDGAIEKLNADPKRIYLIGVSNGGYMGYRMACEHADVVAGIVSIAGMTFKDPALCSPSQPVNILHIHGTTDTVVYYGGGNTPTGAYPGAVQSIEAWAAYNGCQGQIAETKLTLDLHAGDPELDSRVTRYAENVPGGAVELWTIQDRSSHTQDWTKDWTPQLGGILVDWLLAHPKP